MNFHANDHGRGLGRSSFGTFLAGLSAMLFVALPSAWGGHGTPGGNGGSGPVSYGGDETVGTLPVIGGGRIDLPFTTGWRGIEPAFALEGLEGDLFLAIEGARGRGFVSYEVIDAASGRIRLAFHGDVLVTLNRELATNSPIDFGLAVPASYAEGRYRIGLGQESLRNGRLRPGVLPLPVAALASTDVLEDVPLRIKTANPVGIRTAHSLSATTDLLVLRQSD